MRIVAVLHVYNERRVIAATIEHLREQGVDAYVVDNESEDETLEIAESYLGRGVIGIESLPRQRSSDLRSRCRHVEALAARLDADWLMHHDADELRISPRRGQTLAEAIRQFDEAGFDAVNFLEFTFIPTREAPDHEHGDFERTMRWYYPFLPFFPHRLNAWKRQDGPVDLAWSGGHKVRFPGMRAAPQSLFLKHYMFLSVPHAIQKFVQREFDADAVAHGWHGWRATIQPEQIRLPFQRELRTLSADHLLDPSEPWTRHFVDPARNERAGRSASEAQSGDDGPGTSGSNQDRRVGMPLAGGLRRMRRRT